MLLLLAKMCGIFKKPTSVTNCHCHPWQNNVGSMDLEIGFGIGRRRSWYFLSV